MLETTISIALIVFLMAGTLFVLAITAAIIKDVWG